MSFIKQCPWTVVGGSVTVFFTILHCTFLIEATAKSNFSVLILFSSVKNIYLRMLSICDTSSAWDNRLKVGVGRNCINHVQNTTPAFLFRRKSPRNGGISWRLLTNTSTTGITCIIFYLVLEASPLVASRGIFEKDLVKSTLSLFNFDGGKIGKGIFSVGDFFSWESDGRGTYHNSHEPSQDL